MNEVFNNIIDALDEQAQALTALGCAVQLLESNDDALLMLAHEQSKRANAAHERLRILLRVLRALWEGGDER